MLDCDVFKVGINQNNGEKWHFLKKRSLFSLYLDRHKDSNNEKMGIFDGTCKECFRIFWWFFEIHNYIAEMNEHKLSFSYLFTVPRHFPLVIRASNIFVSVNHLSECRYSLIFISFKNSQKQYDSTKQTKYRLLFFQCWKNMFRYNSTFQKPFLTRRINF